MYIIETEVSRKSYTDGYPEPQNPLNSDIPHKNVLILTSNLPLVLTRGHFSFWFPLMFCDHLLYYKGINVKNNTKHR
jgi:hypothetical protein